MTNIKALFVKAVGTSLQTSLCIAGIDNDRCIYAPWRKSRLANMQIACVDPTEAGSWINEQVARDVSRQLGLGRITQFNKETKTWLVTFDNGDTDEYTYIEILGAKQLFKDNKDREEGAVIVSIVSAVKRAKPRRTQTEIIASYEDYFNTAMNQLVDNGNDPNKAELSKKQCAAVLTLGFGKYEKASPTGAELREKLKNKIQEPVALVRSQNRFWTTWTALHDLMTARRHQTSMVGE